MLGASFSALACTHRGTLNIAMSEGTGSDSIGVDAWLMSDASTLVTAAHELKAPLALVRQLSLALETGGLDALDVQRMLRQITLTSERGLRLTSDLTRASRLQDSLFELEPINPHQLCEEVAHEMSPLFTARGREIHVADRKGSLLMIANRELTRRILLGFADNALQHIEEGTSVVLQSANVRGAVRVSVRDFGPALPIDVWRRLESRLGKQPQSIQGRPGSSGLGLYLAGQFANAMNGTVGATRHRDGASFYLDVQSSRQLSLL